MPAFDANGNSRTVFIPNKIIRYYMKIEIFEIDFGTDGDLYFVTKHGNNVSIPNGEILFEKWCDRHGLSNREQEIESDGVNSSYTEYDKSPELMKEFAMDVKHLWIIGRDSDGELYGAPDEIAALTQNRW